METIIALKSKNLNKFAKYLLFEIKESGDFEIPKETKISKPYVIKSIECQEFQEWSYEDFILSEIHKGKKRHFPKVKTIFDKMLIKIRNKINEKNLILLQ